MQFTKILYKNESLQLVWQEDQGTDGLNVYSLKSKADPHPNFMSALRCLDEAICKEAELPLEDIEYKRHDVLGVIISYEVDDMGSIVMSASILSDRFMTMATDMMRIISPMKPESSGGDVIALDPSTVSKIYDLIDEAEAFVKGKRHDLFSLEQ